MTVAEESVLLDSIEHRTRPLRPEILTLAQSMTYKLDLNEHKRAWQHYGRGEAYWFLTKLREEVEELQQAMLRGSAMDVMLEAADVCNFALFIHDLAHREGPIGDP